MEILLLMVFFAPGTCKEGLQFCFAYSSQHSVVPILPEAAADKFQVPAKHLLSSTSAGLVATQKMYLFLYSSSLCSCQGVKYNFCPEEDGKARWDCR